MERCGFGRIVRGFLLAGVLAGGPWTMGQTGGGKSDVEADPFDQGAQEAAGRTLLPDPEASSPSADSAAAKAARAKREATMPAPVGEPPATGPATRALKGDPKRIEQMIVYYADVLDKSRESANWVERAMTVVSASRLDDPRITDRLLEISRSDAHPFVRIYAFEALYARAASLTPAQREAWVAAGCKLAAANGVQGRLRVDLVRAIEAAGPSPERVKAFMDLFERTNSYYWEDQDTLSAMRGLVATWRHKPLIANLVTAMGDLDAAPRAASLLDGLGALIVPAQTRMRLTIREETRKKGEVWSIHETLGSRAAWRAVQKDWQAWLNTADLTAAPPTWKGLRPSTMMPAAERLEDPSEMKWRKGLEVPPFQIAAFQLCFVLDSTDSMGTTIRWIQSDIGRMMRCLRFLTPNPQMGVTLYRDYEKGMKPADYLVMLADGPRTVWRENYVVKMASMTSDGDRLARTLASCRAAAGGDTPEAVYEGLWATFHKQNWAHGKNSKAIAVLVGDAPPHAETMAKIKEQVLWAVAHGCQVHTVKVTDGYRQVPVTQQYDGHVCDLEYSFDLIAEWGKGKAMALDRTARPGRDAVDEESLLTGGAGRGLSDRAIERQVAMIERRSAMMEKRGRRNAAAAAAALRAGQVVPPPPPGSGPDQHYEILAEVLRSVLAEAYHDRVNPFVRVLMELARSSTPEKHPEVLATVHEYKVEPQTPHVHAPEGPARPPEARPETKTETKYYLLSGRTLGRVTVMTTGGKQTYIHGELLMDYQGHYLWRPHPPAKITATGVPISQEKAQEFEGKLKSAQESP